MKETLNIIKNDPWLEPFADAITGRHQYALNKEAELTNKGKQTLSDFASGYLYFGLHRTPKGWTFREWAPNATHIYMVGTFNNWEEKAAYKLKKLKNGNWEINLPADAIQHGDLYKLNVYWDGGQGERIPAWATRVVQDEQTKIFSAQVWAPEKPYKFKKKTFKPTTNPLLIYECHIGMAQQEEKVGTYNEFREKTLPRIAQEGYNCIQIMAIQEHPYYGSFGYHVSSFFAASSRFGTPDELKALIDAAHEMGIAVIMDIVHSHAVKNEVEGLGNFAGDPNQYFYPAPRREHPAWDSLCFDYGKNEVKNFLVANALFWLREFHVDGIRVDAVASMLYLDYGKKDGQWLPNKFGGNKNLEAIEFFHHLNSVIRGTYPGFLTIAEESTAWPNVTSGIGEEGLGFSFKWNMGWMHDFCEYMKLDPLYRKGDHYAMTFAMSYNDSENYILPLSHDEVVHLKCSMVNKMPGYPADKYANLRVGYSYMFGHSGKKLLFMGQDFGQEREWSEERELDWYLLGEKLNQGVHTYVKELLKLYRKYPALYELDNTWDGFEWMNADDAEHSTYCFVRKCSSGKNNLLFVLNMTPMKWENYTVPVPKKKKYKLLLNSDEERFGGWGNEIPAEIMAEKKPYHYKDYSISFDLPPYGAAVFLF